MQSTRFRGLVGSFLLVVALAGCATAPSVVVPTQVDVPVAACPVVTVPAEPVEEPLASRAAADVIRTAEIRIEQWRAYARQLETLLAPYTKTATKP